MSSRLLSAVALGKHKRKSIAFLEASAKYMGAKKQPTIDKKIVRTLPRKKVKI